MELGRLVSYSGFLPGLSSAIVGSGETIIQMGGKRPPILRSNAEKAEARSQETKFWDCSSSASSVAPREWLLFATNLH